jgi:hypothetical protein
VKVIADNLMWILLREGHDVQSEDKTRKENEMSIGGCMELN